MKFSRLLSAINSAPAAKVFDLVGAWNELRVAANESTSWFRVAPFGEHPVTITIDGERRTVMQVMDREAADLMVANYGKLGSKIASFFRGIPVYEGHPDDSSWLAANPGVRPAAVGRIKELQTRDDGLYGRAAWNDRGRALLDAEAPEYSGQSPHWGMNPVDGRSDAYRPCVLWSSGLTNTPNISDNTIALNELGYMSAHQSPSKAAGADEEAEKPNTNTDNMNPELLKRLGLEPNATPEQIAAAITKLLSDKESAESAKTTAESATTAANTARDNALTQLRTLQGASVTSAITTAINEGRITEANRATWEGILGADFANGSAALNGLPKASGLNTTDQLGGLGERRAEGQAGSATGIAAINSAVRDYAKEHGIDITTNAGWTQAFNACEQAKPELFTA